MLPYLAEDILLKHDADQLCMRSRAVHVYAPQNGVDCQSLLVARIFYMYLPSKCDSELTINYLFGFQGIWKWNGSSPGGWLSAPYLLLRFLYSERHSKRQLESLRATSVDQETMARLAVELKELEELSAQMTNQVDRLNEALHDASDDADHIDSTLKTVRIGIQWTTIS